MLGGRRIKTESTLQNGSRDLASPPSIHLQCGIKIMSAFLRPENPSAAGPPEIHASDARKEARRLAKKIGVTQTGNYSHSRLKVPLPLDGSPSKHPIDEGIKH